jgi:hypothetical protein
MLQKDGDINENVSHRIKVGWLKWRQTSDVLCDQKGKFYRTTIRPTMYGAKYCPNKWRHVQQLSIAEMRMLRWICDNTKRDRVRNDDIRERLGMSPVKEKLVQHRLRWFEHIQQRPVETPVRSVVIRRTGNETRGRGRPNLTWKESVKRDLMDWCITKKRALDRSGS